MVASQLCLRSARSLHLDSPVPELGGTLMALSSSSFHFSNLCGTVYRQGNVQFTPDGNSVISPVGNRVSVFDLVK